MVVTHGQSADPFWSVVVNGVRDAAVALDVDAEYQAPGTFNVVEMSDLIEAAIASRPDGLVVSIPDEDALGPAIRSAIAEGIAVISINSGSEVFEALGIQAHIGQTEYEAGFEAGRQLIDRGVSRVLCVNQEVGNVALDLRCQGLKDALGQINGEAVVLAVDLADPDDTRERIAGRLAADNEFDGILTLGPAGAAPALDALAQHGRSGEIVYGTFDLSLEILAGVRDGVIAFAVDQQPYLQGYLAISVLAARFNAGALPQGVIRTGPAFVTQDDATTVIDLVGQGLR